MRADDFKRSIAERAILAAEDEEPYAVKTAWPAVLFGVRYLLPGDSKSRLTYLPFEIRSREPGHEGWDGTECAVPHDTLVLMQGFKTGWIT